MSQKIRSTITAEIAANFPDNTVGAITAADLRAVTNDLNDSCFNLLSDIPLRIDQGGTGQITANNALNALLPSQAGHVNQVLKTDGTNTSWSSAGSGSVQSVTGLNTDNTDPVHPVVNISVDGITITGAGTPASPLVGSASTPPGGVSGAVQYNNAGVFGGFGSWNGTVLNVGGALVSTQYSNANGTGFINPNGSAAFGGGGFVITSTGVATAPTFNGFLATGNISQWTNDSGYVTSATGLFVNNATNATLTRTGAGPYTLGLNLANANTWTGQQTFNTSAPIIGTATASTAAIFDASKNLISSVTTSAELAFVSGVTSSIQTQLNGKQATITLTTTGTSGAATFIANTLNIPQYQAAGTYVTSVTGTTNRITSSGGTTPAIDISAAYVGQTSITTLGTLTGGATGAGFTIALTTSTVTGVLTETHGGTNQSTYTLGDILYSSAANTLSKLSGNTTAVKQYLSQTGTGTVSAAPAWATISGADITGAALTKTDDTNVTMTLGGTPATALLRAASMTLGWTGTLSGTRGGTGVNNGANTITLGGNLTTSGAFNTTLTVTATTSVTLPTTGTLATLAGSEALTNKSVNGVTLTTGGSATTYLNGTGAYTTPTGFTNPMTNVGDTIFGGIAGIATRLAGNTTSGKQYLSQTGTGTISAAPVWATISGADVTGAALTKTDDTNVTLTLGGSPSTALLNAASLTLGWTGTLSGTRGGTGINNGSNTITLGGNFATSGAFATTLTVTAATNVTLPTTGTLATLAGSETLSNKTGTASTNTWFTLTTTGTSGAATYTGNTLNIPQYTGGGSSAFSALTSSTNTTAAMVVGTGASLTTSGSGTITATAVPVTGITGMGTGVATWLVTPSSANLAAAITDETGSGALVFGTSPTLATIVSSSTVNSGTSGTGATLIGVLSNNVTAVATVGSGNNGLMTFTLPANTFSANGKAIRITCWGTKASTVNAKSIFFEFPNSTSLLTQTLATSATGTWGFEVIITRTASNAQIYVVRNIFDNAVVTSLISGTSAQTDTASITFRLTATTGAANDVIQKQMLIEMLN